MDEAQIDEPVFEPTEAHPADENPENYIGVEVKDPWLDETLDEAWKPKGWKPETPEETA